MCIMSRQLYGLRHGSDKCCRENQSTHFIFGIFSENLAVCEIVWKNILIEYTYITMCFCSTNKLERWYVMHSNKYGNPNF